MKVLLFVLCISLYSINCFAQSKSKDVEFSLDKGDSIVPEDASEMESIDSTNFDKAFEDPKKKHRSRKAAKKPSVKKATSSKKKNTSTKSNAVAKPSKTNGNDKVPLKKEQDKKTVQKKKETKKETYLERMMRLVKVEYGKAKIKLIDLSNKLKKKWDLSK